MMRPAPPPMKEQATDKVLGQLAKLDSCSVANAVDSLRVRLLNVGSSGPGIACRTPALPPMVGRAVTLRVRSSEPPVKSTFYLEQPDWWERLEPATFPRVLVVQDADAHRGAGSLVGPVHACILRALGFSGVVASGAVRGTDKFEEIGLHAFSASLSPSHAYSHVVEMGSPVEVGGVRIAAGDIVHGDLNGFVVVPEEVAERIPALAEEFRKREHRVCAFCAGVGFTPAKLRRVIGEDASRG
jgi:4-hydroxy-4-methyl-2-oxoglutarate aldolase